MLGAPSVWLPCSYKTAVSDAILLFCLEGKQDSVPQPLIKVILIGRVRPGSANIENGGKRVQSPWWAGPLQEHPRSGGRSSPPLPHCRSQQQSCVMGIEKATTCYVLYILLNIVSFTTSTWWARTVFHCCSTLHFFDYHWGLKDLLAVCTPSLVNCFFNEIHSLADCKTVFRSLNT